MIMSIEKVKAYFNQFGMADKIQEFDVSSATVALRAMPDCKNLVV